MIVYGYTKQYQQQGDGTLLIQVRIPAIHGPYNQSQYQGRPVRNYTEDDRLPWYPSLLLPYMPSDGDVVALCSKNDANTDWVVIGLTGGSYSSGITSLE